MWYCVVIMCHIHSILGLNTQDRNISFFSLYNLSIYAFLSRGTQYECIQISCLLVSIFRFPRMLATFDEVLY